MFTQQTATSPALGEHRRVIRGDVMAPPAG